jgi:membrane-bound metal-dependent hydrolase YbcI (DUF457 family)
VTIFEHAMLGSTLALALGCRRRHGWALVVVAAVAAALPDWDGLSLAFGVIAYAKVHRVWGHNVLIASIVGATAGGLGYLVQRASRFRRATVRLWPRLAASEPIPPFSGFRLACWVVVGMLAALSHLPADLVYSGNSQMRSWPVQLLWPFSDQGWVWPLVAWGDLTTTLIFIGAMFALYRWPGRAQVIAGLTLLLVHGYVGLCWLRVATGDV